MLFEFGKKAAPTVEGAYPREDGILLKGIVTDDDEHEYFVITRYASEADALADVDGVVIEEEVRARRYRDDDDLNFGVEYWYSVYSVDEWENESEKSVPVSAISIMQAADSDAPAPVMQTPRYRGDRAIARWTECDDPRWMRTEVWIATGANDFTGATKQGVPSDNRYALDDFDPGEEVYLWIRNVLRGGKKSDFYPDRAGPGYVINIPS